MSIVNRGQALAEELIARIDRDGPIGYDEYLEAVLYDPSHGFYSGAGAAGRRGGDFLTSPEVGPLFGAVVARALDDWWHELGDPDLFTVVEVGAGRGALAQGVVEAEPECAGALRYLLVERSSALRRRHGEHLALSDGDGPGVVSLDGPPGDVGAGVVLANELLDNLPWRLLERRDQAWQEVLVGCGIEGLVEKTVPVDGALGRRADLFAPGAPDGARLPLQERARAWVEEARAILERGRVVVFDYTSDSESMVTRPPHTWLRTYRDHDRGGPPLEAPGTQDVTCEVAIDQLPVPDRVRRQWEFLGAYGVGELADEGRRQWEDRAHLGDLAAIRARSRVAEAQALVERGGMGDFHVLEWSVGEPAE